MKEIKRYLWAVLWAILFLLAMMPFIGGIFGTASRWIQENKL